MAALPIQIFEHESLTIHKDEWGRCITSKQFELLCQYNDNNQNKYFTVIRNGVKFAQYVGVIQIGSLTIEILPKADKRKFTSISDKKQSVNSWRRVLLKMLKICGNIKVDAITEANLNKRHNSLLDLYYEIYLNEIESLLRTGLIKKYRKQTGNVRALKGQLRFAQNIQQNLIHQERFYTTHQTYDFEHTLNQILIKGLRILATITCNPLLADRINRLLFAFPEIKEIEITENTFKQLILNRKSEKYSEAIKIAKMIILNYSPDIIRGQENMLALLFDMNDLWEKYIYKMLKKDEKGEYEVNYQGRQEFWNTRLIKPDIILVKDKITYIIDTKWKIVAPNKPSDDDLKQMYAYNMYWDAPKSMLLYPMVDNKSDGDFGDFHKGRAKKVDNKCKVGFVSVFNEKEELNQNISEEIVNKFKP